MAPRRVSTTASPAVQAELHRAAVAFGDAVRDARLARASSVAMLSAQAGMSPDLLYRIEAGRPASTDACARVAVALGRRLELNLVDPRRRGPSARDLARDVVHSAMGEFEARRLRSRGLTVGLDEPYQHYQFAGRADLVAWDLEHRSFLHVENRTRFPDFQEMAGAYNAKRAYLATSIGDRLGVSHWAGETHVIAALWSSEVLHALRLRPDSFRSLCPDEARSFADWWNGAPQGRGMTSALILLDPMATERERAFVGLEQSSHVRPRYRGYAEMAKRLAEAA